MEKPIGKNIISSFSKKHQVVNIVMDYMANKDVSRKPPKASEGLQAKNAWDDLVKREIHQSCVRIKNIIGCELSLTSVYEKRNVLKRNLEA